MTSFVGVRRLGVSTVAMSHKILARQRVVIEDSLAHKTQEVAEKWKWLADMHNQVLGQHPVLRDYLINAGEPRHSFRSFVSTLGVLPPDSS